MVINEKVMMNQGAKGIAALMMIHTLILILELSNEKMICGKAPSKSWTLEYGKANPTLGRYGVNAYWFLCNLGNFALRPGRRLYGDLYDFASSP